MVAIDNIQSKFCQSLRFFSKMHKESLGFFEQFCELRLGVFNTEQCHQRRLSGRRILAGGFSSCFWTCLHIKQIVGKLKGKGWDRFTTRFADDVTDLREQVGEVSQTSGLPIPEFRRIVSTVQKGEREAAKESPSSIIRIARRFLPADFAICSNASERSVPISPTLPLPLTLLLILNRTESSVRLSLTRRFAAHSAVAVFPVPTSP